MNNQELSSLINALIDGEISEEGRQALENQMMTSPVVSEEAHELLYVDELLKKQSAEYGAVGADFTNSIGASMSQNIAAQATRALWLRRALTSAGIAGAGVGLWFLLQSPETTERQVTQETFVNQRHLQSTLPYETSSNADSQIGSLEAPEANAIPNASQNASNVVDEQNGAEATIQVQQHANNIHIQVINERISKASVAGKAADKAYWMVRRAEVFVETSSFDKADEDLKAAIASAQHMGIRETEIEALGVYAELKRAQGDIEGFNTYKTACIEKAIEGDFVDLRRKWQSRLSH